jgi:cytochrome c peroxidase
MRLCILSLAFALVVAPAKLGSDTQQARRWKSEPIHTFQQLGLPPMSIPSDDPLTASKISLGRRLFTDRSLSGDQSISCATCHDPAKFFTDGRKTALGVRNRSGFRNAPSLLNVGFLTTELWDGRVRTLEAQVGFPICNPLEMDSSQVVVLARLANKGGYREFFEEAFGPGPITFEHVGMAIAAFERSLISGDSRFDKYFYGGEENALSAAAKHGLRLFVEPRKGNCASCHRIYKRSSYTADLYGADSAPDDKQFALFTDNLFHNTGIGFETPHTFKDLGRFLVTRSPTDIGAFKTPSLRNVSKTGPYMHDGSLRTLEDVIRFYDKGGNRNPNIDTLLHPLHLTPEERRDLVEFLQSLDGAMSLDEEKNDEPS